MRVEEVEPGRKESRGTNRGRRKLQVEGRERRGRAGGAGDRRHLVRDDPHALPCTVPCLMEDGNLSLFCSPVIGIRAAGSVLEGL